MYISAEAKISTVTPPIAIPTIPPVESGFFEAVGAAGEELGIAVETDPEVETGVGIIVAPVAVVVRVGFRVSAGK